MNELCAHACTGCPRVTGLYIRRDCDYKNFCFENLIRSLSLTKNLKEIKMVYIIVINYFFLCKPCARATSCLY